MVLFIQKRLWEALKDCFISGQFVYSQLFDSGRNPCLHIEGFGVIALPVIDTIAEKIIKNYNTSSEATLTSIDRPPAQNVVQIPAEQLSFVNPKWETHVQKFVGKYVAPALGVQPSKCPVAAKLHQVVVAGPGERCVSCYQVNCRD